MSTVRARRPHGEGRGDVHKHFGRLEVLKGIALEVTRAGGVLPHRPVGLGQEHVPPLHQPPREDRRRPLYVDGELVGYKRQGEHASTS